MPKIPLALSSVDLVVQLTNALYAFPGVEEEPLSRLHSMKVLRFLNLFSLITQHLFENYYFYLFKLDYKLVYSIRPWIRCGRLCFIPREQITLKNTILIGYLSILKEPFVKIVSSIF